MSGHRSKPKTRAGCLLERTTLDALIEQRGARRMFLTLVLPLSGISTSGDHAAQWGACEQQAEGLRGALGQWEPPSIALCHPRRTSRPVPTCTSPPAALTKGAAPCRCRAQGGAHLRRCTAQLQTLPVSSPCINECRRSRQHGAQSLAARHFHPQRCWLRRQPCG